MPLLGVSACRVGASRWLARRCLLSLARLPPYPGAPRLRRLPTGRGGWGPWGDRGPRVGWRGPAWRGQARLCSPELRPDPARRSLSLTGYDAAPSGTEVPSRIEVCHAEAGEAPDAGERHRHA